MKHNEQWGDTLRRLFPEDSKNNKMEVGGRFVRNLTIQVTEACNLRCTYCYEHNKSPLRMSWDTAKAFIDLILASDERTAGYIQSRECPGAILDFIGGEPFLEIDLIQDISDYFIEQMILTDHPWLNRYRFAFSTNGTLFFEDKVQNYLKKHLSHVSMTVTLDGTKEMHDMCRIFEDGSGSFDLASSAAEAWKQMSGQEQGVKITIAPSNLDMVEEAILHFIGKSKTINANCVFENVWEKKHATELYYQLVHVADYMLEHDLQDEVYISILDQPSGDRYTEHKTWCGGSGLMLCVDPRGDLYPCVRYTPVSVGNKNLYILGNVHEGITRMDRVQELSQVTRDTQVAGTKCETCPISQGCADCAGYSYEVFGTVGKRTDFICDMHIARVLAQVYYRNKCYQKTGIKTPLKMNCPKDWALEIIDEDEFHKLEMIANDSFSS